MSRRRFALLGTVALAAASIVLPSPGAHAAVSITKVIPSDGTAITFGPLPAGVWLARASGVYRYDDDAPGASFDRLLADAECSSASPWADGIVDTVLEPGDGAGLSPSPVAEWQRYRWLAGVDPHYTDVNLFDPLDVYVDGLEVAWIPPAPTVVESSPQGVVALCDTKTHIYETLVLSDGVHHTTFNVYDLWYPDNTGNLTVTVEQVL